MMFHKDYCRTPGKRRHSIFFRILVTVIITAVVLNLLAGFLFKKFYPDHVQKPDQQRILSHGRYIKNDIGVPFDSNNARQVLSGTGLELCFSGPEMEWASSKETAKLGRHCIIKMANNKNCYHSPFMGGFFTIIKEGERTYCFISALKSGMHRRMLFLLISAFSIIMAVFYVAARRIISPLKNIMQGVAKVGSGDLDHRIPVKSRGEFGDLSRAFNEMTGKISSMVKSKEQLLLDVSHELRSPLTRAKVALEFIKDKKIQSGLQTDLNDMETMITEILEGERLNNTHGKLNMESTDLYSFLKTIADGYNTRGDIVIAAKPVEEIIIDIDRKRIQIVLKNLIENGLKYSRTKTNPVKICFGKKDDCVEITVEDNGKGIPEEDLENVFEPFYRVDKSRSRESGGFGLGLNLCKKIIEAHGGSIHLESKINQGTKVILKFKMITGRIE
ncbi:MAG: HAMP domain-containing sensor histidine kinase [bacterium]